MGDAFWAEVVKKWSDACENVVALKKELTDVCAELHVSKDTIRLLNGEVRATRTELSQCRLENDEMKKQLADICDRNEILESELQERRATLVQDKKTEASKSYGEVGLAAGPALPTFLSTIPEKRRLGLMQLPLIVLDTEGDELFTREFLKLSIGGSIQPLIVKVTDSQTPLAKRHSIDVYLCPGLDHNPWCPTTPGQHGFIFVGLGREDTSFSEPQTVNVFVGFPDRYQKQYRYLGLYIALRVDPLDTEEWKALPSVVKHTYASRTQVKTKDSRSVVEIMSAYDAGQLLVPCVRLQCIDFDALLYTALLTAKNSAPVVITPHARKRKHNEQDLS